MLSHEVVEQGPFQQGAIFAVDPEAAAAEFGPAGIVDHTESFNQVNVVLRCEVELGLFAKYSHHGIVFLATGNNIIGRQVRQGFEESLLLCLKG